MALKLTSSAATETNPSRESWSASVPPILAEIGGIRSRSERTSSGWHLIWWCVRSNGWTPCRDCRHRTADAAVRCWRRYFTTAERT